MRKLLSVLALAVTVTACGSTETTFDNEAYQARLELPARCIGDVFFIDGDDGEIESVIMQFDGINYRTGEVFDDAPLEVSREFYNTFDEPVCSATDPRMN